jgi:hypothetical protein
VVVIDFYARITHIFPCCIVFDGLFVAPSYVVKGFVHAGELAIYGGRKWLIYSREKRQLHRVPKSHSLKRTTAETMGSISSFKELVFSPRRDCVLIKTQILRPVGRIINNPTNSNLSAELECIPFVQGPFSDVSVLNEDEVVSFKRFPTKKWWLPNWMRPAFSQTGTVSKGYNLQFN